MWTEFTESIAMWLGLGLVVLTVFTLDVTIKIFFKIILPGDKTLLWEKLLLFENGQIEEL